MKMHRSVAALIFTLFVYQAVGELRVWTDKSGKTIEAEHVRTLTDQVVLRQADGSELRVSLDTLSDRDRRYAVVLTPPRLSINISRRKNSSNTSGPSSYGPGSQITAETITLSATVKKSSSAPYEAPLRAELYVLGRGSEQNGYVVLDKTVERFRYADDTGTAHSFSSHDVNLKQFQYREKRGVEYEGYLLAVYDKAGDVISLKCSKLVFEKNADAILDSDRGTLFDEDFEEAASKRDAPRTKNDNKPKKRFFRRF